MDVRTALDTSERDTHIRSFGRRGKEYVTLNEGKYYLVHIADINAKDTDSVQPLTDEEALALIKKRLKQLRKRGY